MSNKCLSLALHGGAGARPERDYSREVPHMQGLVEAARDRLKAGAAALDVAVETVAALEASGLYVAGRGASPNSAGVYELDKKPDVPARVVVAEYVDVANAFVDRDETGMVNAVLDQIARRFRAEEFSRG